MGAEADKDNASVLFEMLQGGCPECNGDTRIVISKKKQTAQKKCIQCSWTGLLYSCEDPDDMQLVIDSARSDGNIKYIREGGNHEELTLSADDILDLANKMRNMVSRFCMASSCSTCIFGRQAIQEYDNQYGHLPGWAELKITCDIQNDTDDFVNTMKELYGG